MHELRPRPVLLVLIGCTIPHDELITPEINARSLLSTSQIYSRDATRMRHRDWSANENAAKKSEAAPILKDNSNCSHELIC